MLREASAPGSPVGAVARRHDICRSQIYQWRRAFRSGRLRSEAFAVVDFLPVEVCDDEEADELPVDEGASCLISIELRHGRTLRFPSTLPCHEIRRLVAAVELA